MYINHIASITKSSYIIMNSWYNFKKYFLFNLKARHRLLQIQLKLSHHLCAYYVPDIVWKILFINLLKILLQLQYMNYKKKTILKSIQ